MKLTGHTSRTQFKEEESQFINIIEYDTSVNNLLDTRHQHYTPQYSGDIIDASLSSLQDHYKELDLANANVKHFDEKDKEEQAYYKQLEESKKDSQSTFNLDNPI